MLDQHFRSHPHIIDFSNRRFYDDRLRIMTSRPSEMPQSAIRVVWAGGRRNPESSINPLESDAVLAAMSEIVRKTVHQQTVPSIGVVCPFRDQVDAVREQVIKALGRGGPDRIPLVDAKWWGEGLVGRYGGRPV